MDQDILKRTALAEGEVSGKYKDEIYQYLVGENDISILEPHFKEIHSCYSERREQLQNQHQLNSCIKENPEFFQRYIALKCIQSFYFVSNKILRSTTVLTIEKAAEMLTSEKVPITYRFDVYYNVYAWQNEEAERIEIEERVRISAVL